MSWPLLGVSPWVWLAAVGPANVPLILTAPKPEPHVLHPDLKFSWKLNALSKGTCQGCWNHD